MNRVSHSSSLMAEGIAFFNIFIDPTIANLFINAVDSKDINAVLRVASYAGQAAYESMFLTSLAKQFTLRNIPRRMRSPTVRIPHDFKLMHTRRTGMYVSEIRGPNSVFVRNKIKQLRIKDGNTQTACGAVLCAIRTGWLILTQDILQSIRMSDVYKFLDKGYHVALDPRIAIVSYTKPVVTVRRWNHFTDAKSCRKITELFHIPNLHAFERCRIPRYISLFIMSSNRSVIESVLAELNAKVQVDNMDDDDYDTHVNLIMPMDYQKTFSPHVLYGDHLPRDDQIPLPCVPKSFWHAETPIFTAYPPFPADNTAAEKSGSLESSSSLATVH